MCQTIWLCFLGCVHVNVLDIQKKSTFNWQREILSGSQRSTELALRYHLVVVFRGARASPKYLHQNWISSPPKYMTVLKKKKAKKTHKQTKRKGSGSKTCPFFNGGSGLLFGIKA